jgi:hypothetical protein
VDRVKAWDGRFELDLPGGWRLGDATETIEAFSVLGDGAVHFSVIEPSGSGSWEPEVVALEVAERALSDPAVFAPTKIVVSRVADATVARCAYGIATEPGVNVDVLVAVWDHIAVLGSSVWPNEEPKLRFEGEQVLTSIAPTR